MPQGSRKSNNDPGGAGPEGLGEEAMVEGTRVQTADEGAEGANDEGGFFLFVCDEDDDEDEDEFCCTEPPHATAPPWALRRPPAERRKVSATKKHC